MAVSVQVIYPVSEGTTFDFGHYADTHMRLCQEIMGPHLKAMVVTKGTGGGAPGSAPGYHAVATFVFEDEAARSAALAKTAPLGADLANFTNVTPHFLIGDVIA